MKALEKNLDYSIIYQLSIELDRTNSTILYGNQNTKNNRKMLKNS